MSVVFRISCCLCRKNIPLAGDVIALDGEWQRRYPDMLGTLACERCVIDYGWSCCTTSKGGFVDGHVAAPADEVDTDSWSHHLDRGTHRALVAGHPRSGLLQGAELYLRWRAGHKDNPDVAATLGAALDEWDTAQRNGAASGLTAAV
ncbi:hypothetical protein ACFWB1_39210 [Streptomyces goshikiensis]|uniref:hypothetical protein n=1 Tax=Streptomyces goshikiensis TaxID=1942 RepID=UPI0036CF85A6